MAVTVKNIESKVTAPKRNITVKGALIDKMVFYDETGDVTKQVLEQFPEGMSTVDVKISIELDPESDDEE